MASRGLEVVAVEPSAGLRAVGETKTSSTCWIDDRLPHLTAVRRGGDLYEHILCSAVLMLVPTDRSVSFATLADLLAKGGSGSLSLAASWRVRRPVLRP